jgi:DNA-binding LytR/AlgR family response regulator
MEGRRANGQLIKVLVVDDEIPSQKELAYIINQHPDFEVAGTAGSGREALELLSRLKPQVAFLDIQLYDINGMDLAEKITHIDKNILIIFATAHDNFAVKAYELNALDYVVKPFDEIRIFKTLDRIRSNLTVQGTPAPLEETSCPLESPLERICAVGNGRYMVINCKDIVYVMAEERKTLLKLKDDYLPSSFTLQELSEKLDQKDFLRVHRAYIVNLRHIKEVIPWFNGSFKLIMEDRQTSEIPVSRHYARDLKQRLGL